MPRRFCVNPPAGDSRLCRLLSCVGADIVQCRIDHQFGTGTFCPFGKGGDFSNLHLWASDIDADGCVWQKTATGAINRTGSSQASVFALSSYAPEGSDMGSFLSSVASSQLSSVSAAFFIRSSRLSPSVMQPGRSGNSQQRPPFPSPPSCTNMKYVIFFIDFLLQILFEASLFLDRIDEN